MDITISISQIQDTKSFEALNDIQKIFSVKRSNREILTNGLIVHRNTKVIPSNIVGYNLLLLHDLILSEETKFDENSKN
jgi:hypothetical protein